MSHLIDEWTDQVGNALRLHRTEKFKDGEVCTFEIDPAEGEVKLFRLPTELAKKTFNREKAQTKES